MRLGRHQSTLDASDLRARARDRTPEPGLLFLFCEDHRTYETLTLHEGAVELGRGGLDGALTDRQLSRKHVRISHDGDAWRIVDLESRNGTYVDGVRVVEEWRGPDPRVIRIGLTILLPQANILPFRDGAVRRVGETVLGPTMAGRLDTVARLAASSRVLHLHGETGTGKDVLARHFHTHSGAVDDPFVALNCGAIPMGLAEGMLFGARRGAYTGASSDTEGTLRAADGGTLFLDEIGELEAPVQAKLLRVLETREVTPLGETRAFKIDVRVCSATHKSLRAEVAAGRFREDLYFRLGQPVVEIPPLRERLEEIPALIELALERDGAGLQAHGTLVEACLLRPWPGNIRELFAEIKLASIMARDEGEQTVQARHLAASAGQPIRAVADPPPAGPPAARVPQELTVERVVTQLQADGGNVAQAARSLGVHRSLLQRFMGKHGLSART